MSDHGHHDPGGHELEAINTKLLFRLLVSLSFITLMACVVVVQWFYAQRRELDGQYAADGSTFLMEYKAKMAKDLEGIDRVAQDIAGNPALLAAPPPPPGWMHPDDLVAGVAAPADGHDEHDEHGEPGHDDDHGEHDDHGHGHGDASGAPEPDLDAPVPVEPEGDAANDTPPAPAEADGDSDSDAAPKPEKPAKPAKPAAGDTPPKPAKPAKPAEPKPANDGE